MVRGSKGRGRGRRGGRAGFGLVEVLIALAVTSLGVLAAAGVSFAIGGQGKLAGWQADQALAALDIFEAVRRQPFSSLASGVTTVTIGPTSYDVDRVVTSPAPRLKHVRLVVRASTGRLPAVFESRVLDAAPPPAAP